MILTICPSIHPDKFKKMSESFHDTISGKNSLIVIEHGTVTEAINQAFKDFPNADYYHVTNDDVEYKTKGWDTKLAMKGKISYGNDFLQEEALPTFPMIDGDIVRALGWLQMPRLNHGYCSDNIWGIIGRECNCLEYKSDVILKHHWHHSPNEKVYKEDMEEFAKWLMSSHRDINKIKAVLNG